MSLYALADHMASKGRNGDTMLVHMTPGEVAGLHALALAHGGKLTINPDTGLPEANFLKKMLPMIIGMALGPLTAGTSLAFLGATPLASAMTVGGITTLATGSLSRGLMAGLGAYGGASLGAGLFGAESAGAAAAGGAQAGALAENLASQGVVGEAANTLVQDAAKTAISDYAAKPFMEQVSGSFGALKDAGGLGSLARPAMFAATPMLADQGVQTTTKMPQNQGYLRPYTFDPYTQRLTALKPVSHQDAYGSAPGGKAGGLTAALAGGGAVAFAEGGASNRMPTIEQKRPEDVMSGMSLDAYNALMGKGSTATKQWETAPMRPYFPVIRKPDNAVKDDIVVGNPPTGGVDRVDNPFQPIETIPTYPIFNNDNNTTNVNTFEPIDTPPVNYIVDFAPTDISPDTPPVNYIRDFAPIGDFAPTDISPDIAENPYDFAPVGSDNLYTPTESDSRLTEKYVYTPSVTVNPYEDITQNPYINKDSYLDDYLGRDFGGGGYNPLEDSLMYSEMAGYADGGMTGGPVFINRNGNLITVGDIAQYTDPFSPPKTDPGPGMRWVWESSKGMWVAAPTSGGGAGSGSQFNDFVGAGGAGGIGIDGGPSPGVAGPGGFSGVTSESFADVGLGESSTASGGAPTGGQGEGGGPSPGGSASGGAGDTAGVASSGAGEGTAPGDGDGEKRGGLIHRYAMGGLGSLGGYSDGGRLLRGPGDGVSDSIPATIANRRPARLADGEFVVPARIVSELGNGSTEAGARKLYAMMDRVQRARGKTTGKGRVAVNSRAHKHLPA